jgi:invasion protein IalB
VLLIVLGFLIAAVVGVLAGFVSPGQLVAPFTGAASASVSAPAVSQPAAAPAVETASAALGATPALPAAKQPRMLREETFGDWRFFCVEAAPVPAAPNCSAVQQLRVAETGAAVFVWRIVQDGHGGLVGVWQVPETVLLTAGLTLDAGTPKPLILPFESCGGGSCQVVANLASDFIQTLSATKTLSAAVVLTNRQSVKFPLSPNGLADALAALSE